MCRMRRFCAAGGLGCRNLSRGLQCRPRLENFSTRYCSTIVDLRTKDRQTDRAEKLTVCFVFFGRRTGTGTSCGTGSVLSSVTSRQSCGTQFGTELFACLALPLSLHHLCRAKRCLRKGASASGLVNTSATWSSVAIGGTEMCLPMWDLKKWNLWLMCLV